MTDQFPNDTPPASEPAADFASADAGETGETGSADATSESREWISQLQSMINGIATQAAPVAKEIGAKAAELAAVAAVKAGPAVQRAAEFTNEYGSKFAERAQAVAADLRTSAAADVSSANGSTNGHASDAGEAAEPNPEETSGSGV